MSVGPPLTIRNALAGAARRLAGGEAFVDPPIRLTYAGLETITPLAKGNK